MKLITKIILSIAAIYMMAWVVLAAYFSFAGHHEERLESNLSSLFKRPVTIESVNTAWVGMSPAFEIVGLKVAGDSAQQPAFSFKKVSGIIDPVSALKLWPSFTQFAVEEPEIEIVNLDNGLLQVAGTKLNSNQSVGVNPKRLISWLLDHESVSWHAGRIVWRRSQDKIDYFDDISFIYERQEQSRSTVATIKLPEGALAFKSQSQGDIVNTNDWSASLEILGEQGKSYLGSDELSLSVSDGKGLLLLKQLGIEKIRDFLQLTGIGGAQNWVIQSELAGQLNNVQFDFSGPLFDFHDWSLTADATEVGFKSTENLPAMNNLNGSIQASSAGGLFDFATESAEFSWQRWFSQPFPIREASGEFEWDLSDRNKINIKLSNAVFSDQVTNISNLNAAIEITTAQSRISNFADLFKINSIEGLSFEAGEVVDQSADKLFSDPVFLDASANFNVPDVSLVENYFPKDPRIGLFREWWQNAVTNGSASEGYIRYQGNITKGALYDGGAQLNGRANYKDVELDYGYERDWPALSKAEGIVQIQNSTLSFLSGQGRIGEDQIGSANVAINSIFRNDRTLDIKASMQSSVQNVMDFLFDGPLLDKQSDNYIKQELPVNAEAGLVDAFVEINIPLNDISLTTVAGSATVKDGRLILPEDVPISSVSGLVNFTHNSVESNNLKGEFLGGQVTAKLLTTEKAQPPILKLEAQGNANVADLQPWVGEHLLSWMDGETDWQGSIVIDGPKAEILAVSELIGVDITAPAPLKKSESTSLPLEFGMLVGSDVEQTLSVRLGDNIVAKFAGDSAKNNHLLDKSIISLGGNEIVKDGINFDINYDQINLDNWLQAIIGLSSINVADSSNTLFLDSMRSVKLRAKDPYLLGRKFGPVELSAVSSNGGNWIGSLSGDNVDGIVQAEPRADVGNYRFNLSKLHIPEGPKEKSSLQPIDNSLLPDSYPILDMNVNSFRFVRKQLGHLQMRGEPADGAWKLTNFKLEHQGVSTLAQGQWLNSQETGTITSFDIQTSIDEAGGALQELDMGGLVSKGEGSLTANINWIGAPHEFDYSRLNGDFDLRVQDGELVKIEPGTGKLLGLLNFNAIARRLTLDFSDVFSSGLEFDRMRYTGAFADGEAIMREAYIFTPAVFVNMQGKLDLDKELIDMEVHLSPELGGNLTLLSALANPAAGALVFLTQQLFKDEMRSNSYKSYRALGTWEDFEMVEFDVDDDRVVN